MHDSHWLAWAAGFFDGEGCVTLMKNRHAKCKEFWFVRTTVTQVDPRPLVRLREMFGGSIQSNGKQPKTARRPAFKWNLSGPKAESFLEQVMPWLITKHEQAELAIQSRRCRGRSGMTGSANLEGYRWLAKQLSTLKWAVPQETPGLRGPLVGADKGN